MNDYLKRKNNNSYAEDLSDEQASISTNPTRLKKRASLVAYVSIASITLILLVFMIGLTVISFA